MSITDVIQRGFEVEAPLFTQEQRRTFNSWRIRILYATIFGYAAFYLLRQNFALAMPSIIAEYGYSKAQMGMVMSSFLVVYGIGKFVNGYFSDRSDARYFMSIGLFMSALISLAIGFSDGLYILGILWILNGWVQSMGWPPTARLISHWYSPRELGTKWAICSSSHQVGAVTISLLAPLIISQYGWRYAFFIPALVAIGFAGFIFDRVRDTPKDVGLPPVEEYKGDVSRLDPREHERITLTEVWSQVIKNRLVWYVGLGNMCLYIPRLGIMIWAPTFLREVKGVSLMVAGGQAAGFEAAGLIGGLAAGWLSDKVFKGRRGPVAALFMVMTSVALFFEWMIPAGYPWLDTIVLIAAGFFVYGPQVLAGLAATDFASKRATGVATGMIGTLAYVGSSVSGVGVGYMVDHYGWGGGFALFVIAGLVGAFFFALTWRHRAKVLDTHTL